MVLQKHKQEHKYIHKAEYVDPSAKNIYRCAICTSPLNSHGIEKTVKCHSKKFHSNTPGGREVKITKTNGSVVFCNIPGNPLAPSMPKKSSAIQMKESKQVQEQVQAMEEGDYEIEEEQEQEEKGPEPQPEVTQDANPEDGRNRMPTQVQTMSKEPNTETCWPSQYHGNILRDQNDQDEDDEFEGDDSEDENEQARGTQLAVIMLAPWGLWLVYEEDHQHNKRHEVKMLPSGDAVRVRKTDYVTKWFLRPFLDSYAIRAKDNDILTAGFDIFFRWT